MSRITFFVSLSSLLFGLGIYFSSCSSDQLPASYDEIGICFETEILPIIISNCTQGGCHNPIDRAEGLDYSTYNGIMESVKPFNANKSELYEYIISTDPAERMPLPPYDPLSIEEIALIKDWIEKGAPETIDCQSACDSTLINPVNVSFQNQVLPILDAKCNGCHSGPSPDGGIDQSTWSAVKATVNDGSFLGCIKHEGGFSPMPKFASKLPSCEIDVIETWVNEGALDN